MRKNKGFTLVEILIVVVILGILAAIVIPQFSDASTQSKISSAKSSLQTLRSQVSLYRIQHSDDAPTADAQLTGQTDGDGNAGTQFGPYVQSIPKNPFISDDTADDVAYGLDAAFAADGTTGWYISTDTGDVYMNDGESSDLNGDGDAVDAGETHASW